MKTFNVLKPIMLVVAAASLFFTISFSASAAKPTAPNYPSYSSAKKNTFAAQACTISKTTKLIFRTPSNWRGSDVKINGKKARVSNFPTANLKFYEVRIPRKGVGIKVMMRVTYKLNRKFVKQQKMVRALRDINPC